MEIITVHKAIVNDDGEYLDIEADCDIRRVSLQIPSKDGFKIETLEQLNFLYDEIEQLLMNND